MRPKLNKRQQQALEHVRDRFVHERINGYIDVRDVRHDPVSPEEADRQWDASVGQWEAVLFDPDVISRLGLAGEDDPIPAEFIKPLAKSNFERPEKKQHYRSGGEKTFGPCICADCGESTRHEYYMLHCNVWEQAAGPDIAFNAPDGNVHRAELCIGCVEKRLGRRLTRADFMPVPMNFDRLVTQSDRLASRLAEET